MDQAVRLLRMLMSAFVLVSSVLLFALVALRGEVQPPPTFEKQYHSMLAGLYLRTANPDLRRFIESEIDFQMLSASHRAAMEVKIWENYLADPDAYEADWGEKSFNVFEVLEKRQGEYLLFLIHRGQHLVKQPEEADRIALRMVKERGSDQEQLEGQALRDALDQISGAAANLSQQLRRRSFSRFGAQNDVETLLEATRELEQHARAEPPYLLSRPRYKAYVYEAFDREPSSGLAAEAREIVMNPAEDTLLRLHACRYLKNHLAELRPIKERLLTFAAKEADAAKANDTPDDAALRLELLRLLSVSMEPLPEPKTPAPEGTP